MDVEGHFANEDADVEPDIEGPEDAVAAADEEEVEDDMTQPFRHCWTLVMATRRGGVSEDVNRIPD